MVKIRLYRTGTKKRPMYRIVAIDQRRRRQGRVLEQLGTYNPVSGGDVSVDEAKFENWVSKGAELSDTVGSIIKRYRKQAALSAAGSGA